VYVPKVQRQQLHPSLLRKEAAGSYRTLISFYPNTKVSHTPNPEYRSRHHIHHRGKSQTSNLVHCFSFDVYFFPQINNSYCRPHHTGQKTSTTLNLFMLPAAGNRMANQLPLKKKRCGGKLVAPARSIQSYLIMKYEACAGSKDTSRVGR